MILVAALSVRRATFAAGGSFGTLRPLARRSARATTPSEIESTKRVLNYCGELRPTAIGNVRDRANCSATFPGLAGAAISLIAPC